MKLGRKILTAVPVGFTRNGDVDLRASREILRFVAASGVQGGFAIGTTGEFASLDRRERQVLGAISLEELAGLETVIHVGAPSAYEALRLLADARDLGATRVAVITPYYLPTSDSAVLGFFAAVSAAAEGMSVFVYIFQARTGFAVSDELLAKLANLPNIVGAKVSGDPIERLDAYRSAVPDSFELMTGSDADLGIVPEHGGSGVVSGVASAFPEPFVRLAKAAESNDDTGFAAAQSQIDDVVALISGDPARMKETLRMRGIDAGYSRMALDDPAPDVVAALRRAIREYT
jgi:4-hydroxy-tetrahydrodipicolinate synthase